MSNPIPCPSCGRSNDFHDSVTDEVNYEDGDVTICWSCHSLAVFLVGPLGAGLRKPTVEEFEEYISDPRIIRTLEIMKNEISPVDAVNRMRMEQCENPSD